MIPCGILFPLSFYACSFKEVQWTKRTFVWSCHVSSTWHSYIFDCRVISFIFVFRDFSSFLYFPLGLAVLPLVYFQKLCWITFLGFSLVHGPRSGRFNVKICFWFDSNLRVSFCLAFRHSCNAHLTILSPCNPDPWLDDAVVKRQQRWVHSWTPEDRLAVQCRNRILELWMWRMKRKMRKWEICNRTHLMYQRYNFYLYFQHNSVVI